jgi:hypothetical protein
MSKHAFEVSCHAMCFASCVLRIEEFMRQIWPNEIAQIVAEDNAEARATIRGVTDLLRNPHRIKWETHDRDDILPLQRVRGPVQFAGKSDSRPLQLADACAFLIRRRYFRHDDRSARFYRRLRPMMLMYPTEDDKGSARVGAQFGDLWTASVS